MNGSFAISRKYEKNLDNAIRKEKGIYYTPYSVVNYILDNTLKNHDIVKNPCPKVLDMCCGCGNFLLRAYDLLYKKIYENLDILKQKYGKNFISKEKISIHIIKNCLFAVDTDIDALEILKNEYIKILQIESEEACAKSPLFTEEEIKQILNKKYKNKFNIFCGDSLKTDLNEIFGVNKFDYIIGNPPYVGQKRLDNNYKKFLYKEFKAVYRDKGDLYFCFYKRILDFLKKDGKAGIITPRYFMQSPSGKYLRKYLVENAQINKIVDFLGANLFTGLGIASCIVLFEHKYTQITKEDKKTVDTDEKNQKTKNYFKLYKIINENINIRKISNLEDYINEENFIKLKVDMNFLTDTWIMVKPSEFEFYNKIQDKSQYFLEEICESFQGIITGCDKAFVIKKNDENIDKIDGKLLKIWIKNKDIGKYIIKNSQYKLIYSNDIKNEDDYSYVIKTFLKPYEQKLKSKREYKRKCRKWYELQWGREKEQFEQKKIMFPYKSKYNRFAIDTDNCYCSADVYSLQIKKDYKTEFSYEYLVALLNSKIYDRYFKIIGKEMGNKVFDYYPNKIMKLKIFKDENYDEIQQLSKQIISLSKQRVKIIDKLQKETDENLTIPTVRDNFSNTFKIKNNTKMQDKKISLLKEKHYLENKIDFIENRIEEIIKKSLDL